jgi:hypothetical protein
MPAKQLTYEGVLKMFRKTDRKIRAVAEQQAKTERTVERMSTEVERVSTDLGRLGNRIGDIIEHMVGGGNIVEQFQALNYNVTEYSRNRIFGKGTKNDGEIDLILEDGDIAILISVKTKLTTEYVHEHIEQLEKYRRYVDAKGNGDKRRFIGAVAGAVAPDDVIKCAQKKGFYVIVQSGVAVEIVPTPENFRAKEW